MIISGIRARIIKAAIVTNLLMLVVQTLKRPDRWLYLLREVQKKRSTVQGLSGSDRYVRCGGRYFITENVPGWPSKAFNVFLRNEIARLLNPFRISPLSTIIVGVTSRCVLSCGHCYEWKNISPSEKLTVSDLKQIIGETIKSGVRHIQLSGGEPMERFDDLIEIVKFASDQADIWILTSGYGLSPERALALKRAGLTGADISLDHWDEDEHNRSRSNAKAYFWVREAVKNCNDAGLVVALSLCAFRSFVSADNLDRYRSLARSWNADFIRLLEPRQAGKFTGMDIELNSDQISLLDHFFLDSNSSVKYSDFPIVTYPGHNQRRAGCFGAGNRYMYIDSAGEIHACPFCQKSAGNALSARLEDAIILLRKHGCQQFETNLTD